MNGSFANLNKKNEWMGLSQKPWVGLTDEERQVIALEVPIEAVLITEAKLKQKNGFAEEKNT